VLLTVVAGRLLCEGDTCPKPYDDYGSDQTCRVEVLAAIGRYSTPRPKRFLLYGSRTAIA
jgi:hypothetical protein